MLTDYQELGLNKFLINNNSPMTRPVVINSVNFDSQFDTSAVSIDKLNKNSIFKLSSKLVQGTFTIGTNTQLTINSLTTFSKRKEARSMALLSDLYITQRDDTHVWNSVSLKGDIGTNAVANTKFVATMGQRENQLNNNKIGATFQITNDGTASNDYILDTRLSYIPVR